MFSPLKGLNKLATFVHLCLANCPTGDGGLESEFQSCLSLFPSDWSRDFLHPTLHPVYLFLVLFMSGLSPVPAQTLVHSHLYHGSLSCWIVSELILLKFVLSHKPHILPIFLVLCLFIFLWFLFKKYYGKGNSKM